MMDEPRSIWRSLLPLFAGVVFGIGWWLFIAAHIVQEVQKTTPIIWAYFYIPGIVATFGLVMTNIVDVSSLNGESFMAIASPGVSARIRVWLFFSFFLHFGAMIASVWIMASIFLSPTALYQFPGIALTLQSFSIFVASMILLWNRAQKSNDYSVI